VTRFADLTTSEFSIVMNRKLKLDELNRLSIEEFQGGNKTPIVVVLDNIRSLNNIGSFFRTADAFNVEQIYLCGITAKPPHRDIQKTALGATESVAWKHNNSSLDALLALKSDGYKIYSVEQTEKTIPLQEFKYRNEKIALVFGNEVSGVEQDIIDISDGVLEIPQFGTKHSFNVSVSAGIVLWHLAHQRL